MLNLNKIVIWHPKYSTNSVLIDVQKIREHNKIVFTKAESLKGHEYYLEGSVAKSCPITTNGRIPCFKVPMSKLERMA